MYAKKQDLLINKNLFIALFVGFPHKPVYAKNRFLFIAGLFSLPPAVAFFLAGGGAATALNRQRPKCMPKTSLSDMPKRFGHQ